MKYTVEKGFQITRGERHGQSYNVYIKDANKYYTVERYTDGSFMHMNCWYSRGKGIMNQTCMRTCKEGSYAWKQVTKAINASI